EVDVGLGLKVQCIGLRVEARVPGGRLEGGKWLHVPLGSIDKDFGRVWDIVSSFSIHRSLNY
ncbi:MAG: hypothetical protein ABJL67_21580, partial [Sulfitobacter sp.]